jgi:hypothetical protein
MIMDFYTQSMTAAMLLLPPLFVTNHSALLRKLRGLHDQVIFHDRHPLANSFDITHLWTPQMAASHSTNNCRTKCKFPELVYPTSIIKRPFRVTQVQSIRQHSYNSDQLTTAWWQPIRIDYNLPTPTILDLALEPSMGTTRPEWAP